MHIGTAEPKIEFLGRSNWRVGDQIYRTEYQAREAIKAEIAAAVTALVNETDPGPSSRQERRKRAVKWALRHNKSIADAIVRSKVSMRYVQNGG